ncbi:MAG: VIT domain-containing protein [Acidimicrobiia bacterium]
MNRLRALLATVLLVGAAAPAAAQVVEPPPRCFDFCPIIWDGSPVVVERYTVDVDIDTQVATTHITQVLRNDGDWVAEGFVYLPVPSGAAVTDLALWIDNEPVGGELLTAEEAEEIYRDIVRTLRDPALLQWLESGLVQLSVFPIAPGDTRTVEIEYIEVLTAESGLVRLAHPLGSELNRGTPIEQLAMTVTASTADPLRAIYSATHDIDVDREDERRFVASFEERDADPDSDFVLYYSTSGESIGVDVLSFRERGEDGYFLLLAAPGLDTDVETVAKDVVVVLDRSGSMEGQKFEQALEAARFVLDNLGENDRFNVITFSSTLQSYASRLQPADAASDAAEWLDRQAAAGSTDINRALLEAVELADDERPAYVIFLTDGLPTEGVQNPDRIIDSVVDAAPDNVSVFAFGVGFDVDTVLLDSLAENHHGTTSYVVPGERIDEIVSGFYAKVTTPVLTRVQIDIDGVAVRDLHPREPGDLFAGEQLALVGRYDDGGPATITLRGLVNGETTTFTYEDERFRTTGGAEFLPRLWATRKVGSLLKDIRLHGASQEVIEQIIEIASRYGIVTPYTSFLVTEPRPLTFDDVQEMARDQLGSGAFDVRRSGEDAVAYSSAAEALTSAQAAPEVDTDSRSTVRVTGSRAFVLVEGVWTDTAHDGSATVEVPYLSDAYFALAASRPEVAEALALEERVLVQVDGVGYEIVAEDAAVGPVSLPEPLAEDPPVVASVLVTVPPDPATATTAAPSPPPTGAPSTTVVTSVALGTQPAIPEADDGGPPVWLLTALVAFALGAVAWRLARRRRAPVEEPTELDTPEHVRM